MEGGDLLFIDDVHKLIRVSKNTIRRKKWREKTGIPMRKIGNKLCGYKQDVITWIRRGYNV